MVVTDVSPALAAIWAVRTGVLLLWPVVAAGLAGVLDGATGVVAAEFLPVLGACLSTLAGVLGVVFLDAPLLATFYVTPQNKVSVQARHQDHIK